MNPSRIIKELKKKPLSGKEIYDSCDGNINIYTYKDLLSFNTIDQAFGDKNAIALLYETKPKYGHWVGLLRYNGHIEFFDSYGKFIDDQLDFVPRKFRRQLGEDYPYLSKLLYESPYEIIYNPYKLQKSKDEISSCGRHVIMRCTFYDFPLDDYVRMLTSKTEINNPDEFVTYLTAAI